MMIGGTLRMIRAFARARDRKAWLHTLREIRNLPERRTKPVYGSWGRSGRWF